MDASGNIGNVNDWTSAKGVTGVVLITPECEFVIASEELYIMSSMTYSMSGWGAESILVSNIMTTTSSSTAITDFNGASNTSAIITQYSGTDYKSGSY
jgi:hypothetical protein